MVIGSLVALLQVDKLLGTFTRYLDKDADKPRCACALMGENMRAIQANRMKQKAKYTS